VNLCLHSLRVSTDKKYFAGDVHKNIFSGCNVPENRYNETRIWRAEVWLQSLSVSVLDEAERLTPRTGRFSPHGENPRYPLSTNFVGLIPV